MSSRNSLISSQSDVAPLASISSRYAEMTSNSGTSSRSISSLKTSDSRRSNGPW